MPGTERAVSQTLEHIQGNVRFSELVLADTELRSDAFWSSVRAAIKAT